MLHMALRGVQRNTGRYVATLLAIVTGVAFFAATGFISDHVIKAMEGDADRQYQGVDVAIVVDDADAGSGFAEPLTIAGSAAADLLALEGVEAGGGVLTGPVAFLAEDGSTFGDGATGRLWISDDELNPVDVVDGSAPESAGEIAVDRGLADEKSLQVGDQVTVLTVGGQFDSTIVGITEFGDQDALDQGGTVSIPEASAFAWLRDGWTEYDAFYLRTSGSSASVTEAAEAIVPTGFRAQTGEEFRADARDQAGSFGRFLKTGLQAFAGLALFVGAFVIYNTFSVIVAQRQRELAVLSAIGATPKQLKRSLRFEGLVIGLVGSLLGVMAGAVLALVLLSLVAVLGVELPGSGGITVTPATVIQGVLFGTLITYFSVTIPARRAAKVEPIEALRDAQVETGTTSSRRAIVAGVFVGVGLIAMLFGADPFLIGLGILALVVGIIVAGPFIAVAGAHVFRRVFAVFGLEGRLAVDNTVRNPNRTATTANALLIGVFLVTFVTVAGTSLKDFAVAELQKLESADFLVSSDGGTIDEQLVAQLEAVDGVESVTAYRRESVTVDGQPSLLSTGDQGALVEVAHVTAAEGSLDDLADGTIAVLPSGESPAIGSTVSVANSQGASVDLQVVAVLEASIDGANLGNLVNTATFDSLVGDTAPTAAFIDASSGSQSDTKDAIDELVARRPDITVTAGNALGRLIGSVFDFMINAVNGLLLMSVIVALIGIVNTLSLSILERRRELGLLRIMGMTDRRVQRMVRLESALIAALGTITGLFLGLLVGWGLVAAINRLGDAGIGFSFPAGLLGLVLVLGIFLGFAASFLPARRSTRLEVLEAIQAT